MLRDIEIMKRNLYEISLKEVITYEEVVNDDLVNHIIASVHYDL